MSPLDGPLRRLWDEHGLGTYAELGHALPVAAFGTRGVTQASGGDERTDKELVGSLVIGIEVEDRRGMYRCFTRVPSRLCSGGETPSCSDNCEQETLAGGNGPVLVRILRKDVAPVGGDRTRVIASFQRVVELVEIEGQPAHVEGNGTPIGDEPAL